MSNVAIYYKMFNYQSHEEVILEIEELIKEIDSDILGVYIDQENSTENFFTMVEEVLSNINYLYISTKFEDDFSQQLIYELARNANFKILYFNEI